MKKNSQNFLNILNKLPKSGLIILMLISFLSMQKMPSAYAAGITVNSTADVIADDGQCTLREAITAANTDTASGLMAGECTAGNGDDAITLPADTYTLAIPSTGENSNVNGDLDINSNITINGAGADVTIIDGGAIDRVMHTLETAVISLNNLTIRNGQIGTVDGVRSGSGGGILHESDGTLDLSYINILSNESGDEGGGIANLSENGAVTLQNCTISENRSRYGGGLVNRGYGTTTTTINHSTFSNNAITSSSPTVHLTNIYGGGINVYQGAVTVRNSTFVGNSAINPPFDDSGHAHGGAIANPYRGTLTVINSTISNNSAGSTDETHQNNGGGIFANSTGTTTINNSTIVNTIYGSGLYTGYNNGNTFIDNSIVANNSGRNCFGTVTGSNNIDTTDDIQNCPAPAFSVDDNVFTYLDTLNDNGGATQTHALLAGNPAIDAGNNITCETNDQRGLVRQDGDANVATDACDVGAYEGGSMQCAINTGDSPTFTGQSGMTFFINSDGGNDLACLYVDEVPADHPHATGNDGMHLHTSKFWRLEAFQADKTTPSTTFDLDLTLPYGTANTASRACKWLEGTGAGFGWDCYNNGMPTTVDPSNSVTREDVTSLSEWAIGQAVGPTAVSLHSSIATPLPPTNWIAFLFSTLMLTTGSLWMRRRRFQT